MFKNSLKVTSRLGCLRPLVVHEEEAPIMQKASVVIKGSFYVRKLKGPYTGSHKSVQPQHSCQFHEMIRCTRNDVVRMT